MKRTWSETGNTSLNRTGTRLGDIEEVAGGAIPRHPLPHPHEPGPGDEHPRRIQFAHTRTKPGATLDTGMPPFGRRDPPGSSPLSIQVVRGANPDDLSSMRLVQDRDVRSSGGGDVENDNNTTLASGVFERIHRTRLYKLRRTRLFQPMDDVEESWVIGVVVPVYTEGPWALKRTLSHLALQQRMLQETYERFADKYSDPNLMHTSEGQKPRMPVLHVCVIFDGVEQADPDTLAVLEEMGISTHYAKLRMLPLDDDDNMIVQNLERRDVSFAPREVEVVGDGPNVQMHSMAHGERMETIGSVNTTGPANTDEEDDTDDEVDGVAVSVAEMTAQAPTRAPRPGPAGPNPNARELDPPEPDHVMPSGQRLALHPVPVQLGPALNSPQMRDIYDRCRTAKRHHPDDVCDISGQELPLRSVATLERMHISVVIKKANRRKHDSHKWFFRRFCPDVGAQYAFATDVGTTYGPHVLTRLMYHLDTHPQCVGASGYQRVMTFQEQQTLRESGAAEGFFSATLRRIQSFDFEAGQAIQIGWNALIGFLPVIPGPCGLYRLQLLHGSAINMYLRAMGKEAHELDLVSANLKIAEDRILTYEGPLGQKWFYAPPLPKVPSPFKDRRAPVHEQFAATRGGGGPQDGSQQVPQSHRHPGAANASVSIVSSSASTPQQRRPSSPATTRGSDSSGHSRQYHIPPAPEEGVRQPGGGIYLNGLPTTDWVPDAAFFFESEYPLSELVKQRRRWTNGTIFGDIWVLRTVSRMMCRSVVGKMQWCCCGREHKDESRDLAWRSKCRLCAILINMTMNLLSWFVMFSLWGFFLVTLVLAVETVPILFMASGVVSTDEMGIITTTYIVPIVITIYVTIQAMHILAGACRRQPYTHVTWMLLVVMNAMLMALQIAVVMFTSYLAFFREEQLVAALESVGADVEIAWMRWLPLGAIFYLMLPLIPGLLIGTATAKGLMQGIVPFLFFLPTVTAGFVSYATSRIDDITWGTKEHLVSQVPNAVAMLSGEFAEEEEARLRELGRMSEGLASQLNAWVRGRKKERESTVNYLLQHADRGVNLLDWVAVHLGELRRRELEEGAGAGPANECVSVSPQERAPWPNNKLQFNGAERRLDTTAVSARTALENGFAGAGNTSTDIYTVMRLRQEGKTDFRYKRSFAVLMNFAINLTVGILVGEFRGATGNWLIYTWISLMALTVIPLTFSTIFLLLYRCQGERLVYHRGKLVPYNGLRVCLCCSWCPEKTHGRAA